MPEPAPLLVLAPNWLGDAVMALPALADLRRHFAGARCVVAARASVADLFRLVPGVDEVVTFGWNGRLLRRTALADDITRLRAVGAGVAVLFPNSFASAWLVRQAAVPRRWGFASDLRRLLLTGAVRRPRGLIHQGEYYQALVRGMGITTGPLEPVLSAPREAVDEVRALLAARGWDGHRPLVTLAPGAAYGTAKQWIPAHVMRLVADLVEQRGATCVLVGGRGDAATTAAVRAGVAPAASAHVIDLAGATSLAALAAVLALSQTCVANDSGAMHLAAAVGTPVVATFGPTIEQATRPLTRGGGRAAVLTEPVWCRPCMLRECPTDHRCMTRLSPARVLAAVDDMMTRRS